MNLRPRLVLDRLRTSLWFVPTLVVGACVVAASLLLEAERRWPLDWQLLAGAGNGGARDMLQAIASSMLSVAALVFSLTLAVLAQSASQYSSRVLRNFIRDRANQTTLGLFLGIYAYCLVVLRGMGVGDGMPDLAVLGGISLAFVGIATLIFFIHHIARSIQGANIVARIAAETRERIEDLLPERKADAEPRPAPELPTGAWRSVAATAAGYVQSIDRDRLLRHAQAADARIRSLVRPGDFVTEGQPLALALLREGAASGDFEREVAGTFATGSQRTLEEDIGFGLRQLVDVALRALSPAVNDTTTGILALDRLIDLLRAIGGRQREPAVLHEGGDDAARARVWLAPRGFDDYVALAFDQIRQSSDGNPVALGRILEGLALVAASVESVDRLPPLRRQLEAVESAISRGVPEACDAAPLRRMAESVRSALAERAEALAGTRLSGVP